MIRKERAEFLDNVLKLFQDNGAIRKKELEIKYKEDSYILRQTEKHLKILGADGMICDSGHDEYHLQPKGLSVLNNMETLGYLARHRVAAAEAEAQEEAEEEGDGPFLLVELILWVIFLFHLDGCSE
jgi:hypothetical protein